MTGFGRAQGRGRPGVVAAEVRSVNHRYLEVACRLPDGWAALEDVVRALVHQIVQRGKVTVTVTVQGRTAGAARLDAGAARRYLLALRQLQRQLRLSGDVSLEHLTALPGVLSMTADDVEAWRPLILQTVRAALRRAVAARQREGRVLTRALRGLVQRLTEATEALGTRAPQVVAGYRTRLEERIQALTTQPLDAGRLEQEIAFFAKECDIAEELTRIGAHTAHAGQLLQAGGREPVGRTLDFVAQELQREVNTVGSKANDVEIARLAIQMKGWVEQLREQAQNIE